MYHQDLFSSLNVRTANAYLTVKSTWAENRRVKNIHTVGCCHHDDSFVYTKTIHLNKKLVQCLLSLIGAATHAGSSLAGNCINFINKDDTRCMTFALFKKVSYTGSTDAYKHLHEI